MSVNPVALYLSPPLLLHHSAALSWPLSRLDRCLLRNRREKIPAAGVKGKRYLRIDCDVLFFSPSSSPRLITQELISHMSLSCSVLQACCLTLLISLHALIHSFHDSTKKKSALIRDRILCRTGVYTALYGRKLSV